MVLGWNIFAYVAAVVVALSVAASLVALFSRGRSLAAVLLAGAGVLLLAAFVVALWLTLGRPPLRTMGETRLWYSLFLLLAGAMTYARWSYRWILCFSTMLSTIFMVINILRPELHDQTLMPALQSPWFVPHVAVYMFSYALLGCATLIALYALVRRAEGLDEAIDRLLWGGVAFFTVGMLTGALWAKEAWGAYWSWDAKEAWAAATWGLYLLAMHVERRRRVARYWIIVAAFVALQMCWWGVNYLPTATESVHTYNQQ